jgi:AcrR family transcriptional regulator
MQAEPQTRRGHILKWTIIVHALLPGSTAMEWAALALPLPLAVRIPASGFSALCASLRFNSARMARTRALTFDRQRASILQAAAHLFSQRGFEGASMARLAQACGISKPLLYHYYRDKQHILFDIADTYIDRLLSIVAEVHARKLPAEESLRALIARFMQEYRHSQAQHMVLVQDVKFLADLQREQVVQKERKVVDAFAAAIAALQPRLRKTVLRVPLTMILFGMINWTFTWLRADGPLSYEDMAEVVTEVFLRGITDTAALDRYTSTQRRKERKGKPMRKEEHGTTTIAGPDTFHLA